MPGLIDDSISQGAAGIQGMAAASNIAGRQFLENMEIKNEERQGIGNLIGTAAGIGAAYLANRKKNQQVNQKNPPDSQHEEGGGYNTSGFNTSVSQSSVNAENGGEGYSTLLGSLLQNSQGGLLQNKTGITVPAPTDANATTMPNTAISAPDDAWTSGMIDSAGGLVAPAAGGG